MPMPTLFCLQIMLSNLENFVHMFIFICFIWFLKWLVNTIIGVENKDDTTKKEDIPEMTEKQEQVSTSINTNQLYDYFIETKALKVESPEENILKVELLNNGKVMELLIEIHQSVPIIMYYVILLKDFPDNRLFKLSEFIVRLNQHFFQGIFGMIMEERQVTFRISLAHNNKPILIKKHENILSTLKVFQNRYTKDFHNVANNDLEPIAAVMEALTKS